MKIVNKIVNSAKYNSMLMLKEIGATFISVCLFCMRACIRVSALPLFIRNKEKGKKQVSNEAFIARFAS